MARILCIDYGIRRCGIAATDPFQIIVSAVTTIETLQIFYFLENYLKQEVVEKLVIGLPVHKDGKFTHLKTHIDLFTKQFRVKWPDVAIDFADEQFSSVQAKKIIMEGGAKKKTRQDKALIDRVSAVIILQRYLNHI
ncbi:MAG: Holliday junction resolvase RuvX [Saprospiraceae bacterium]|nr:Holliday junction resolvase RuvX [Saprospiraceae bacterium]